MVYAPSLDISKAFDKVSHYRLFICLIKAGLPKCITDVLVNWYSKLTSAWNTCISRWFTASSGVRQGGFLPPAFFLTFCQPVY